MKSLNLLKINSPFFLVFGIFIVLASIFIAGEVRADHLEPPQKAGECRELAEDMYVCEQLAGVDINENSQSDATGDCKGKCWDNDGIVIRTGGGGQFGGGGQIQWYCYGVTDSSKTCKIDNTIINLATGERTEEDKGCGFLSGLFDTGCLLDKILSTLGSLGGTLIVSLLGIIADLIGIIFLGVSKLFGWMIGAVASITVSPNHPETVQIVKDGWQISRDIANMFFIIILSFIGLATILGIESYQAKKTLPRLLIIALLMNFSGVLVGFIVDIGNLFTNFFLQKSTGLIWSFEWPGISSSGSKIAEQVAGHLARIVFYMVASLIYLAVAFLFFIRVFFLWTLVILAPLAFAAYVLPATKQYWDRWWSQLIQWSIIGIPMAFFIYLSRLALEPATQNSIEEIGRGAGPIASFMGPFIALFLLFFGITLSTSMAQNTANRFLGFGKGIGAGLGVAAGVGLWRKLEGDNIKEGGGRISRIGSRLKGFGSPPEGSGRIRKAFTTGARWTGIGHATRLAGRGLEIASKETTMRMGDKDLGEQRAAEAQVGNRDSSSIFNRVNAALEKPGPKNWNKITGWLNAVRNRGDGDDIEDAVNSGVLKKEIIGKAIKTGQRIGPPGFRPLLKSFYGPIMTDPKKYGFEAETDKDKDYRVIENSGKDAKLLEDFQNKTLAKFDNKDFEGDTLVKENFDSSTEAGRYFLKNIVEQRDADFLSALARRPDKKERDALVKYIFEEMYGDIEKTRKTLAAKAPGALRYITSTGARNQGIGIDLTPEDAENLIKAAVKEGFTENKEDSKKTDSKSRRTTGGAGGSSETPSDRKPTGGSRSSKKEGTDSSPESERKPI